MDRCIGRVLVRAFFKQSFPPIFLGIIISGLIRTLVSIGIFASLDFIVRPVKKANCFVVNCICPIKNANNGKNTCNAPMR